MRSALVKHLICPLRGLRARVTLEAAFSGDLDTPLARPRGEEEAPRPEVGPQQEFWDPGLNGAGLDPDGDTSGLKHLLPPTSPRPWLAPCTSGAL